MPRTVPPRTATRIVLNRVSHLSVATIPVIAILSSLLILVSAFAGRDLILRAYHHAVAQRYRFYSYGDCMLIL